MSSILIRNFGIMFSLDPLQLVFRQQREWFLLSRSEWRHLSLNRAALKRSWKSTAILVCAYSFLQQLLKRNLQYDPHLYACSLCDEWTDCGCANSHRSSSSWSTGNLPIPILQPQHDFTVFCVFRTTGLRMTRRWVLSRWRNRSVTLPSHSVTTTTTRQLWWENFVHTEK